MDEKLNCWSLGVEIQSGHEPNFGDALWVNKISEVLNVHSPCNLGQFLNYDMWDVAPDNLHSHVIKSFTEVLS